MTNNISRFSKQTRGETLPLIPMLCLMTILIAALMSVANFSKSEVIIARPYPRLPRIPKIKGGDRKIKFISIVTDSAIGFKHRHNDFKAFAYKEMWYFDDIETNQVHVIHASEKIKKEFDTHRYIITKDSIQLTIEEKRGIRFLALEVDSLTLKKRVYNRAHNKRNNLIQIITDFK